MHNIARMGEISRYFFQIQQKIRFDNRWRDAKSTKNNRI